MAFNALFKVSTLQRVIKKRNCLNRPYFSKTGVYGYVPRAKRNDFKIPAEYAKSRINNVHLYGLVTAFRDHGHRIATLDPLTTATSQKDIAILTPSAHGMDLSDETLFNLEGIMHSNNSQMRLPEIVDLLKQLYSRYIGIEVQHLIDEEKEWFVNRFEQIQLESTLRNEERKLIAEDLLKSQVFDRFLATKFSNVKRYGAEGAESMMPFFRTIFKSCAAHGVMNVVIGTPHRGRLNFLIGLLNFPPVAMFQKMKGLPEFPKAFHFTGDVLSHLRISTNLEYDGSTIHVTLLPNPSHLEAVSPVVVGKARGAMQSLGIGDYSKEKDYTSISKVVPIQVHGDASFAGQGVMMETLATSQVPHFDVGGSLHLVVNNQIGYTTPQHRARSSSYCSDVVKMICAPIIHVNGYFPEEVVKAATLALEYRQKFRKDVLVDLTCFRRWGHNEMDDPTFTNPSMYTSIVSFKSVPDAYFDVLTQDGVMTDDDRNSIISSYSAQLNDDLKKVISYEPLASSFAGRWTGIKQAENNITTWDTGVPINLLRFIAGQSVLIPENMVIHPTLIKHFIADRLKKVKEVSAVDWATAEAMSIGSLLCQSSHVRISGQDVGRGTFSQRHAMFIDQSTDNMYIPLNHMYEDQPAFLEVANSILSEEAVLGIEYGFSLDNPKHLVIWEAQFGDFFNTAQVIFDTCISSGETKWLLQSGIVILLPHGYDGAGPEHSSCRVERFLQMCDSKEDGIDGDAVNWSIVNPTTPAQYFHLLRRQVLCDFRRPLIVVAPKILLRHPEAVSSIATMSPRTTFLPVMGDDSVEAANVKTIVFCSGKHYYHLKKEREALSKTDTAIIRLEELCPFPAARLHEEIKKFKNATNFIWSQEEQRNMGAWTFVNSRFQNILHCQLKYVGRHELGTPAVGIGAIHQEEAKYIIKKTFEGKK